jgi:hypothetical protein
VIVAIYLLQGTYHLISIPVLHRHTIEAGRSC